jgi:hypothetical protein
VIGFEMLLGSQCCQPSKLSSAEQWEAHIHGSTLPCNMLLDVAIVTPSLPLHDSYVRLASTHFRAGWLSQLVATCHLEILNVSLNITAISKLQLLV